MCLKTRRNLLIEAPVRRTAKLKSMFLAGYLPRTKRLAPPCEWIFTMATVLNDCHHGTIFFFTPPWASPFYN